MVTASQSWSPWFFTLLGPARRGRQEELLSWTHTRQDRRLKRTAVRLYPARSVPGKRQQLDLLHQAGSCARRPAAPRPQAQEVDGRPYSTRRPHRPVLSLRLPHLCKRSLYCIFLKLP